MSASATNEMTDPFAPLSPQEEKEVHRVFEMLCDYSAKSKIREEIRDRQEWINAQRSKTAISPELNESISKANTRIEELQRSLLALEQRPDRKVTVADVQEILKFLHYRMSRHEVEEMVWEVDENLDGGLDWSEFKLMYNRNITDRSGLEPSRMFNLTQFLIYDSNHNGLVSVDETMHWLYARYGRSVMEQKLKELFGENMKESGLQGGEISFVQYLRAVEGVQLNLFLSTNLGKKVKDLRSKDDSYRHE